MISMPAAAQRGEHLVADFVSVYALIESRRRRKGG
jgi:hypothetical protein